MTESAVRKAGRKALMATRPMTRVGRAVEKGETQGFLKILVDADTKEILGASLMGIECDEVIHSILDGVYAKAPLYGHPAPHAHPSYDHRINSDASRRAQTFGPIYE
jgi:pyruvate/2-oxoglutarate dehydrogenase complex dihydrolipoamide dehydrogenase (E3) component